jgi:hypothetical protein
MDDSASFRAAAQQRLVLASGRHVTLRMVQPAKMHEALIAEITASAETGA